MVALMSDRAPEDVDTRAGYDRWSEIYDADQNPLTLLEEPVVRRWIDPPRGLRIADVGCGTGRHARWLAEHGARVVAFDFSEGMLARAKEKLLALGVEIHTHALPAPLPVPSDHFDAVLFALVADHLADLEATFRDLCRITRPGGTVIFTVMHPAMSLRGVTARFTDPQTGGQVRIASSEHTFGEYVMAVVRSGLAIEEIVEDKAGGSLLALTPRAEKYLGWPMLLAMRLSRRR
jgi:malonyl-CoA O-methyltransferase